MTLSRNSLATLAGSCLLSIAAALQAPTASAIPINITSISGVWTSTNPGAPAVTGVGTNTISWGTPFAPTNPDRLQSSYIFDPALTPINGINPDTPFGLGVFTHDNFPITGTFLSTAELTVEISFDVIDNGTTTPLTVSSVFDFSHFETPNGSNPCADGGAQGAGVNVNGCADRVTFETSASSDSFVVGGLAYQFNLVGFCSECPDPGEEPNLVDEFWTIERESNTAVLVANYSVTERPIPAPGALVLLGTGLAGLGCLRWRRRAARS